MISRTQRYNRLLARSVVFLAGILSVFRVFATSIDPATWQELVDATDLVGIVECTVAGGIVAEYRVLESWKGGRAGDTIRIRTYTDIWGPQFPIALVGQRFLMMAHKGVRDSVVPHRYLWARGMAVPLWARTIPYDYHLPLFQGRVELSDGDMSPVRIHGFDGSTLEEFRSEAQMFLESPHRGALILKSQIKKYIVNSANPVERTDDAFVRLHEALAADLDVEALVDALLAFVESAQPSKKRGAYRSLERTTSPDVKRYVLSLDPKALPFSEEESQNLQRMYRYEPSEARDTWRRPQPSDVEMALALETLNTPNAPYDAALLALDLLLDTHTDEVTAWLFSWQNLNPVQWGKDAGYVLGSFFGVYCPNDRKSRLLKLTGAESAYIQAAAAVYLCFEDEEAGVAALREAANLEGGAGAWAALNLLRRGHAEAMPRMLALLGEPFNPHVIHSAHHQNLIERFKVLLSNSATFSGVPQPDPFPSNASGESTPAPSRADYRRHYETWWQTHGASVQLHDPWFPILEEQKVD